MKLISFLAGCVTSAVLLGAGAANAGPIVLTFEGVGDEQAIGNYYNGGAGGNDGITFGPDALALVESSAGGSGNFSNPPSGDTVAFFLNGPGDVMDKPSGFNTGFSFFYADQVGFTGNVTVWSGLDGTGTELASLSLPSTPNPYNVWVPVGVTFAGTAESAIFGGSANFIGFDNITLGASTPGGVPEPATWAMVLLGIGAIGAGLRGARRNLATATA